MDLRYNVFKRYRKIVFNTFAQKNLYKILSTVANKFKKSISSYKLKSFDDFFLVLFADKCPGSATARESNQIK